MHQGCRAVASGWMHYDTGRLHQNNEIIILVQRDKGDRFGNQLRSRSGFQRNCDREPVSGLQKILGLLDNPVHQNRSGPDELLNPGTRQTFTVELTCQIEIETLPPPLDYKKTILTHKLTGKKKVAYKKNACATG